MVSLRGAARLSRLPLPRSSVGRLRLFPFEAEKRNTPLILYGNMNYLSLSNTDGDKYPAREVFRPTFGG
jgi:hypothetical protein